MQAVHFNFLYPPCLCNFVHKHIIDMADLTSQQKKEYARTLYLKENFTQAEIA